MAIYGSGLALVTMYLLGAGALVGSYFRLSWPLVVCLLVYAIWDAKFTFQPQAFSGRSVSDINDAVTRSRTYVSWYIAIFGAVLALAFADAESREAIKLLLDVTGIAPWLLGAPLVLAIIVMLFIPIRIECTNAGQPSSALKWLFAINVFFQKVILLVFGHLSIMALGSIEL